MADQNLLQADPQVVGVLAFSKDTEDRMVVEEFPERILVDPSIVDLVNPGVVQMPDNETLLVTVANGQATYKSVGDTLLGNVVVGTDGRSRPRYTILFQLQDVSYFDPNAQQPPTVDLNSVEGMQQAIAVLQDRIRQVAPVQVTDPATFLEPQSAPIRRTVAPIGRQRPRSRSVTATGLG